MANSKKKGKPRPDSGNDIQIEFQRRIDDEYVIGDGITLKSTTGISAYGENSNFEWEGSYNGNVIHVSLPRSTHERGATITGQLPNGYDPDRGSVQNQLYDEIARILRRIN